MPNKNTITQLLSYIGFLLAFWLPYVAGIKFLDISEDVALIAAGISAIPLLFLFSKFFQNLAERVSTVKVAGFELELATEMERVLAIAPAVVHSRAPQPLFCVVLHETAHESLERVAGNDGGLRVL